MSFAGESPLRPILFYENDRDSLLISRNRDLLDGPFRFVIPEAALAEELLDKARVDSHEALDALWPQFAAAGMELVAQEFVQGPESLVESYHVYADQAGDTAAEFTGRKIRTYPVEYGHSTALVTTDSPDVLAIGRDVTAALGLRGGREARLQALPRRGPAAARGQSALQSLAPSRRPGGGQHPRGGLRRTRGSSSPGNRAGEGGCLVVAAMARLSFCARVPGFGQSMAELNARVRGESLVSFDDPMPLLRGKIWESFARRFRR